MRVFDTVFRNRIGKFHLISFHGARESGSFVTCLVVCLLSAWKVHAVVLDLTSTRDGHGDAVQICLDLASEGESVTEVEADLVWKADCVEFVPGSCAAGDHSKPIYELVRGNERLRVTVVATDVASGDGVDVVVPDKTPIGENATLWCCSFRRKSELRTSKCSIGLENIAVRSAIGRTLSVTTKCQMVIVNDE